LFVAGRVLGPDGEPVFFAQVCSDLGPSVGCGADGVFRIGPFPPGPVILGASAWPAGLDALAQGQSLVAPDLEFQAGQEGIELRLEPQGRIAGRLVDGATGEPVDGAILVSAGGAWTSQRVGAHGAFAFGELLPGAYGMSARSPDGLAGLLERVDVGPGGAGPEDLVVRLVPGGQLALRFPMTEGRRTYRVRSGACVLLQDTVGAEEIETPHLPPGPVAVELLGPRQDVLLAREVVVRAGATLLVDLSRGP
jgi:hypothetical protein